MVLPVITGVVRCTFRGTNVAGQQWANVTHYQWQGGGSPSNADIIALDALIVRLYTGAAFGTGVPWFQQCPSTTKMLDATYYLLNGTSIPQIINHNTLQGALATSVNSAPELAHVLTLQTNTRGRRYRGRIYLPAVGTSAMDGTSGQVTATVTANFVNQATGLLGALPAASWKWGVASYGHGTLHGQPTTWTPFFTELQQVRMDNIPDVQRRRKQ